MMSKQKLRQSPHTPVRAKRLVCALCAYRLGRHGKVFLTIPSQSSTDEQKFIQKGEAPGSDSLFDVDPKDIVFFVGGVPPDVKVMHFTKLLITNEYLQYMQFSHLSYS